MFGSFKRIGRSIRMTDFSEAQKAQSNKNADEHGLDKRFIIAIIIISALVLITIIRAFYDPVTRTQLKNLKISLFDILSFTAAVIAYFVFKKRGKK